MRASTRRLRPVPLSSKVAEIFQTRRKASQTLIAKAEVILVRQAAIAVRTAGEIVDAAGGLVVAEAGVDADAVDVLVVAVEDGTAVAVEEEDTKTFARIFTDKLIT